MNAIVLDTVPIWTLILGVGVFLYVLLDGFDLGVGMLFGLAPDTPSRNLVMNSIAPIWDGNETWLVLGGLALLAAFPLAFAIIIPAVYFPILVMLLALIFRGVAFEFRYRDAEHKTFCDYGFVYGSAIATFAQGMVLGAFIQGFEVQGRAFTGRSFDFLTPFSLLTGLALMFGYGLLGAVWLIVLAYIGIAISLWPNIVPYRFSIWEAASSESTQAFLMVGTLFLLPIILMYTGWSYWVFRGKVRSDIGYH